MPFGTILIFAVWIFLPIGAVSDTVAGVLFWVYAGFLYALRLAFDYLKPLKTQPTFANWAVYFLMGRLGLKPGCNAMKAAASSFTLLLNDPSARVLPQE